MRHLVNAYEVNNEEKTCEANLVREGIAITPKALV